MTPQADVLFLLAPMRDSGSGIRTCCLITDTITRSSKSHVLATCTLVSQSHQIPAIIHISLCYTIEADVRSHMKQRMQWFSCSHQCCTADLEFQKAFNTNVNGQSMVDHLLTLVAQQLQVSIPMQHDCHFYVLQCITQRHHCCAMLLTLDKPLLWLVHVCTVSSAGST